MYLALFPVRYSAYRAGLPLFCITFSYIYTIQAASTRGQNKKALDQLLSKALTLKTAHVSGGPGLRFPAPPFAKPT
jgi:hypothetical protein